MSKLTKIELDNAQKKDLEEYSQSNESKALRLRCRIILLKSERWRSADIASLLFCGEQAVNFWVRRYKEEGLAGLQTRSSSERRLNYKNL